MASVASKVGRELGSIAERLFSSFIAPLVLGGELRPGRPIGGRSALLLGSCRSVTDIDRHAHVQLARLRSARRLVAIDRLDALDESEWALAACLHDIVQSTHPDLVGIFRGTVPTKLLDLIDLTLARIPKARHAGEALSRHTVFSRVFEIARKDTVVSWWSGSSTFLGSTPPPRLTAWPELRRVSVQQTPHTLSELPSHGGSVRAERFAEVMTKFLGKTPLTDFATLHRAEPAFVWGPENTALLATPAGRTLAARAMRSAPEEALHASLGRALRRLLVARAWKPAELALDLMAERTLGDAQLALTGSKLEDWNRAAAVSPLGAWSEDAKFARAAGAFVAQRALASTPERFQEDERGRLLAILAPAATTRAAQEIEALLAGKPA